MKLGMLLLIFSTLCLTGWSQTMSYPKLDQHLKSLLQNDQSIESFNVFVFPRNKPNYEQSDDYFLKISELEAALTSQALTRSQKRQLTYQLRSTIAENSQDPLLKFLDQSQKHNLFSSQKISFRRSFWINNSVYLRGVTKDLLLAISDLDFVREIRGEYVIATVEPLPKINTPLENVNGDKKALEWNIMKIRADQAWNITSGEGVVVANIDTGVRETHEALKTSYRGYRGPSTPAVHDYNWYDPKEFANDPWWCDWGCSPKECCMDTPFDNNGHGTHTMGTIVGAKEFGIGVAPGAKWIAAKGCRDGSCLNYGLTSSAEWVICPTTIDGKTADCTMGADIVSNSWGGGQGDLWYKEYVEAWVQAGMIPVFSQGNSGPKCSTAGSPGDFEDVIGVGATTSSDSLADFSSRGPGKKTAGISYSKPDISAPGSQIKSASSTVGSSDDKKYSVYSGTSMACPHVSGVIALMLSVNPSLTFQEIRDILGKSANKNVSAPENGRTGSDVCDGITYNQLPSFHYGQGIVDALSSVQLTLSYRK